MPLLRACGGRLYIVDGTDVHITRDDGQTAIIQLNEIDDKERRDSMNLQCFLRLLRRILCCLGLVT